MAMREARVTIEQSERRWHELSIEAAIDRAGARLEGLSTAEATRRLAQYGPNRLADSAKARPLAILIRQVKSPLIYILIAAGIVTLLIGDPLDSAVIIAVIVLNSIVGFVQEYKAEESLQALAKMTAPHARVLRDGEEHEIDAEEVVPGDVAILETGMKVPADLRLIRSIELTADESALTGESLPVAKTTAPIPDPGAPLGDRTNIAYLGTSITNGRGAGVAVATGRRSTFGMISEQVRAVGESESPLQERLTRFAWLIVVFVLVVTAVVFVLGLLTGESLANIALTAVATAVATVPEGLPVTVTVALAVGVWRMAQRRAIIRKLPVVETLGSCTAICSDKTGTLTRNEMTVRRILAGGREYEVTGVGYEPRGEILHAGTPISLADAPELALALRIGRHCNASSVYEEEGRHFAHGDPTEAALIVAALKGGLDHERELAEYPQLDERPFSSERQYMATLHAHDGQRLVFVKGSPERVLEMSVAAAGLPELDAGQALAASQRLAAEGLRVLGMAMREAPPGTEELDHSTAESGLTFVGLQAMIDPPRPEAIEAIARCREAGIRPMMITGDHRVTAAAIGAQMGIVDDPEAEAVDGRQLETMSDEELSERVATVSVFARAAPIHKLRIVRALKGRGEIVAVTGDGVNDAPALKEADIGVAMGVSGTDVAKEASDMVLSDDNFATIYAAVEEGRVVFDNIRKVVMFLIPTGIGFVATVIATIVLGLPLPFLPAQIIWVNLATNGLQDVAMAFEPPEGDVGRRPPRDPGEGILTRAMIERTFFVAAVLLVGTLAIYVWALDATDDVTISRSVAMTAIVVMQSAHIFNSRSLLRSAFRMNPLSNRFLLVSFIGGLALQVLALYWGPLQFVLNTVPLPLDAWLLMLPLAAVIIAVVEIDKAVRRARAR